MQPNALSVPVKASSSPTLPPHVISDLQIGLQGRLQERVLSSEQAHIENFRPTNITRVLIAENSYA